MEKMRGSVGNELPLKLTEWISGLTTEEYVYIVQKLKDEGAIEQVTASIYRLSAKGREIVNSSEDGNCWKVYLKRRKEKKELKDQLTRSVIITNNHSRQTNVYNMLLLFLTFSVAMVGGLFTWKSYEVSHDTLNFEREKFKHQLLVDSIQIKTLLEKAIPEGDSAKFKK
jgi:hypothetical protein